MISGQVDWEKMNSRPRMRSWILTTQSRSRVRLLRSPLTPIPSHSFTLPEFLICPVHPRTLSRSPLPLGAPTRSVRPIDHLLFCIQTGLLDNPSRRPFIGPVNHQFSMSPPGLHLSNRPVSTAQTLAHPETLPHRALADLAMSLASSSRIMTRRSSCSPSVPLHHLPTTKQFRKTALIGTLVCLSSLVPRLPLFDKPQTVQTDWLEG